MVDKKANNGIEDKASWSSITNRQSPNDRLYLDQHDG